MCKQMATGMLLFICSVFSLWGLALSLRTLNYSILEERGARAVLGNINNDGNLELPEKGKKPNFRLLENSAPQLLGVDQDSGLLFTKQRIDREMLCKKSPKCLISLEVFVNDKEICMVKVEILDINDNSPKFPSEQIDIEISENALPGTRFPLTTAQDPDLGDNDLKTYMIMHGDHRLFSLDIKSRSDGTKVPELVIEKSLDREEQSHHRLILVAVDGGNPPRSATLLINVKVIDSNDNSPVFESKSYTVEIEENSPLGKIVIDLNASDADEGTNGDILYSFSGYASDRIWELFSLDSKSGIIQVKGNLDYEENGLIEIDVQAEDQGPNPIPVHCKVTVKITDQNDNAPTISFVSVRPGEISEASPPGTVIALVRVTDKDSGKNGQLHCRVIGNEPFKLEDNYDNFYTVITSRPLDREVQDEYNVTIIAQDNGSPSLNSTKSFIVKIMDENDNLPRFFKSLYVLQVSANNIPGEYLGSVVAHDPDLGPNGTVSYSILPSYIDGVSVYTYVSVHPANGAIYALRTFYYELTKYFEFKLLAKDLGSPPLESNTTVRVTILDVNNNAPIIVLPTLQNDTAEIHVPRNAGMGYLVSTIKAMDIDFGESGRLTYEILQGNEEHFFDLDTVTGEIKVRNPYWEDISPVELIVKVTDNGKPSLSTIAKLIIKINTACLPEGETSLSGEHKDWDVYLPVTVTLITISIVLLAAIVSIIILCKKETKELTPYNNKLIEPPFMKVKKKKLNKNEIMLVQSEVEERNAMNVVSGPSLAISPMYFDCQTSLPLSSSHTEVVYLKPTSNMMTVPQETIGCPSFSAPVRNKDANSSTRISISQTDNFPTEPNYMGSRQQFVQSSSTFKDPERASLRDSGHGDSDQADSDQDTNKGSCCDMSVREALKMKTTSAKCQSLDQEQEECINCTEECRVLGHSDRCWMPQFPTANQVENADYRTNLFVPTVEAHVETETYETVNPTGKKTFCTFGKDKREHTILIANVKPYLKAKRALSPLLQEGPSASSSPTKTCIEPCASTKGPLNSCEIKSGVLAETTNHYMSSESQYLSPSKQTKDPQYIASDPMARVFADVHSRVSRDSNEMDSVLEQLEHSNRDLGRESVDAEEVVREIDKLLQDCRGNEAVAVRK
ncbi:protocadherin-17 isoform X3 [Spea bombifrons]|uniref:protocadherin-17 isoform X3 n=1 Tax=Spea bombifrons TaxID=233779 RepID=UPI00234B7CBA|nr:protocadherin-17 isoform X3 [Spea bombifrons]